MKYSVFTVTECNLTFGVINRTYCYAFENHVLDSIRSVDVEQKAPVFQGGEIVDRFRFPQQFTIISDQHLQEQRRQGVAVGNTIHAIEGEHTLFLVERKNETVRQNDTGRLKLVLFRVVDLQNNGFLLKRREIMVVRTKSVSLDIAASTALDEPEKINCDRLHCLQVRLLLRRHLQRKIGILDASLLPAAVADNDKIRPFIPELLVRKINICSLFISVPFPEVFVEIHALFSFRKAFRDLNAITG